jgi:hypothetical protein
MHANPQRVDKPAISRLLGFSRKNNSKRINLDRQLQVISIKQLHFQMSDERTPLVQGVNSDLEADPAATAPALHTASKPAAIENPDELLESDRLARFAKYGCFPSVFPILGQGFANWLAIQSVEPVLALYLTAMGWTTKSNSTLFGWVMALAQVVSLSVRFNGRLTPAVGVPGVHESDLGAAHARDRRKTNDVDCMHGCYHGSLCCASDPKQGLGWPLSFPRL